MILTGFLAALIYLIVLRCVNGGVMKETDEKNDKNKEGKIKHVRDFLGNNRAKISDILDEYEEPKKA